MTSSIAASLPCDTNMVSNLDKSFNSLNISSSNHNNEDVLGFSNNLLTHLKESRERLHKWAKEQKELVDATRLEAAEFSKMEQDKIRSKINNFERIQNGRKDIANETSSCKEKQTGIERQLTNLHKEHAEVQGNINELKEKERIASKKAEQVRKSKERIEAAKNISIEDLTYAVVKYRMTGLDFVKERNDSLGCKFKQLDPSDHDRVFKFSLRVTEHDQYIVEHCEPQLESEVVIDLLDQLNSSSGRDGFPAFIRAMRKAFKDSV